MESTAGRLADLGFPIEAIVIFVAVIAISVWADLFAHRKSQEIKVKDAALWSVGWILISLGWYAYLRFRYGSGYADLFLAGYALEKSLSVDNLMVFIAVFSSFAIHGVSQHRILYYGILGAVVFRFIFIAAGTSLLLVGPYVLFLFAFIVLWSAWKMWQGGDDEEEEIADYSEHWSVKFAKKLMPVFPRLYGQRFFISGAEAEQLQKSDPSVQLQAGVKRYATPMLLCMICIEASDVMFAFDSVPAVIAITQQPLLVYSSIIFAVLGLRSLYFVLAALQKYLVYLEKAVILLLVYIGLKLGVEASTELWGWPGIHIAPWINVSIVLGVLALGVVASLLFPEKEEAKDTAKDVATS
jgi:tellurite resistance protein TerC